MWGLRKQVTEAEEGPLEVRGKKAGINGLGEGEGEDRHGCERERDHGDLPGDRSLLTDHRARM